MVHGYVEEDFQGFKSMWGTYSRCKTRAFPSISIAFPVSVLLEGRTRMITFTRSARHRGRLNDLETAAKIFTIAAGT